MSKLRLTLDELRVESFTPDERPAGPRGTVRAHAKQTLGCYPTNDIGCLSPRCVSAFCLTDDCETQDPGACYTANPDWGTCQPVYTCPECASPPIETDPSVCPVEIG